VLGATASVGAQAGTLRLLALGDSLTAGYLLPQADGFAPKLQRALKAAGLDVEVVNAGVSGDTASDALDRLDWALAEPFDAAIVEVGANDMLRGLDPTVTKAAISNILAKLKEKNVRVLLAGMVAAPGMGHAYEGEFNAIYPELARQFSVPRYAFFLQGVAGNAALELADHLHPNASGVAVIVEGILPSVVELLGAKPRN